MLDLAAPPAPEVTITALAPFVAAHAVSPVDVYLASLAEGESRRTMANRLRLLARLLGVDDPRAVPWHLTRYHHATALRERLQARYAPASANLALGALRGVLRAAWRMGLMIAEEYHQTASVEAVRGERLLAGRALTGGEIAALLGACMADRTAAGRRDAALFAVLYGCGLREAELVGLDVGDHDAGTGALAVRHGKRNKERLVYVADRGAADALADWLAVRMDAGAGMTEDDAGALFVPIRRSGLLHRGGRLTMSGVRALVKRRADAVALPPCSPHDFRRTMAGDLLDAGADIATVARLMGHASVTTTARYDRRPEEAKKRAAALLRVPYRRVEA